jgi:hypothetical protein
MILKVNIRQSMSLRHHVIYIIFGKKLLRACVYCYAKTEFKYYFLILSYLILSVLTYVNIELFGLICLILSK